MIFFFPPNGKLFFKCKYFYLVCVNKHPSRIIIDENHLSLNCINKDFENMHRQIPFKLNIRKENKDFTLYKDCCVDL